MYLPCELWTYVLSYVLPDDGARALAASIPTLRRSHALCAVWYHNIDGYWDRTMQCEFGVTQSPPPSPEKVSPHRHHYLSVFGSCKRARCIARVIHTDMQRLVVIAGANDGTALSDLCGTWLWCLTEDEKVSVARVCTQWVLKNRRNLNVKTRSTLQNVPLRLRVRLR
eukprot:PhM_4_TR16520/c0_g1_i2/m.40411